MSGLQPFLAKALLDHAARVMPPGREQWARAMQAEAQHLPASEQLPFAIGCVRSSYRQFLTEADTMLRTGRWAILFGLCAAGAVCLRTAILIQPYDASVMIGLLGLICLLTAAAFLRWGFERLPMLAAAGFAGALFAVLFAGDAGALFSSTAASGTFYRAILLEQAVGWMALFGVAHLLLALDARRSLPR